ncbi:hypothetical protein DPMN_075055 [Dreissena polymorpha]|uniref:Ig-like domain-containing protein n=1 Tax=Dreissena polymorpha TaxID=45954 RepID=A0A9D3YG38_DREPO|nr:hypothetical protein DPMN_075055 [Dreissena polymorpha]
MILSLFELVNVLFLFGDAFTQPILTVSPNNVILYGDAVTSTATPSYVTIECRMQSMSAREVYSVYIKRFAQDLAEVSLLNGQSMSKISDLAPNDVRTKNPEISGSVGSSSDWFLRIRYLQSRMDCADGATYHCRVTYKPNSGDTTTTNVSSTLSVSVRPGNLQILALRVVGVSNSIQVDNNSLVQRGEQLELTCNGNTGQSSGNIIEWFKMTSSTGYQILLSSGEDTVDDGNPAGISVGSPPTICHYQRTSRLRYLVKTNDNSLSFRCEVAVAQPTTYKAFSQEFMFRFDGRLISTCTVHRLSIVVILLSGIATWSI